MIPPGVQEAKPGWPNAIAANDRMVTPSTSLAGSIASNAARSSICAGTGCCSRMPCTVGSADSARMAATSSAVVVVAGSGTCRESMPALAQRLRFIAT
jgi:hypothetical protein